MRYMAQDSLGQAQKAAWAAIVVAHARLASAINRDLVRQGLLPLEIYDVLLILETSEGGRLTMSALADRIVFSRSGLTRLVDRLEEAGYVERQSCPGDRRSLYTVITKKGLEARKSNWPGYAALIQKHFGEYISDAQAKSISSALDPFVDPQFKCNP